jgi:hypothetical protein
VLSPETEPHAPFAPTLRSPRRLFYINRDTAEAGRCPDCGILVSLELPRFAEPPVRLEVVLRHEEMPSGTRHVGELQSFSPTGRPLLATRLTGRDMAD